MIKRFSLTYLLLIVCNANTMPSLWDETIKVDDPKITLNRASKQCQRSLLYAQDEVKLWCNKAYEMGNWQSLYTLSLNLKNGERLVQETRKRIKQQYPMAYNMYAHLYQTGQFIKKDEAKAITLYLTFYHLSIT